MKSKSTKYGMYAKHVVELRTVIHYITYVTPVIRMYHWKTDSFKNHYILGKLYEEFENLLDVFVETALGMYGKELLTSERIVDIKLPDDNDDTATFLKVLLRDLNSLSTHVHDDILKPIFENILQTVYSKFYLI